MLPFGIRLLVALLVICCLQCLVVAWVVPLTGVVKKTSSSSTHRPTALKMSEDTIGGPLSSSSVAGNLQVTVIGATGFVGSRVCKLLSQKQGLSVTAVSKTGTIPDWCKDEDWVSTMNWKAIDLLTADEGALDAAIGKPDVIISCVGVIGTDSEVLLKGNGDANVNAFQSAKRGGNVKRVSLTSVSSEVIDCRDNWLPEFFNGYFDGKVKAEQNALDCVNGDEKAVCIVKPTFIYGGDSFGFLPPRVTYEYGSAIEELLSLPPFKILADITPGLIKVALRPPSCVDAVAACLIAGISGEEAASFNGGVFDGAAAINAAANAPKAKGLSNFLSWSGERLADLWEKAYVEGPKAITWTKEKIEEVKQLQESNKK